MKNASTMGFLAPLLVLMACGGGGPAGLDDPRSSALLVMSGPQFTANRNLSIELANGCRAYEWNAPLDVALNATRSQLDEPDVPNRVIKDTTEVHDELLRRGMRVKYGSAGACDIIKGEHARKTPLSILVQEL